MEATQETRSVQPDQPVMNVSKGKEPIRFDHDIPEQPVSLEGPGGDESSESLEVKVYSKVDSDSDDQQSFQSIQETQSPDSDSDVSQSKAIVIYFKGEGACNPHKFSAYTQTDYWLGTGYEDFLGKGTFGEVYKVKCTTCFKDYACKVIKFARSFNKAARPKHIQAVDMELRCYMTLNHPHIIKYVHHELSERDMKIYTEYCQSRDLESFFCEYPDTPFEIATAWKYLEGLASALTRCHYGLQAASDACGVLSEYVGFENGWEPILHRDIKPGNILVAWIGEPLEPIPKLGDFGTSFKLQEGGKPPSTQQVGTKSYWATEIAEEERQLEGRITGWSTKSDVWGVGAVIYRILTGKIPVQNQHKDLDRRLEAFRSLLQAESEPVPDLLAQIICECLDRTPEGRPTSLQLLAVTVKWKTSNRDLRRSASFWKALSKHPDATTASSVTKHFVTKYLPALAANKTLFSPKEVSIIMSMVQIHCSEYLSVCHRHLSAGFQDGMAGSTVFHALASVRPNDHDTIRLAFDESQWPFVKALSHIGIKKNALGLLPSACAAARGHRSLCTRLSELEDKIRSEDAAQAQAIALNIQLLRFETEAGKEFDFMFKLLTMGVNDSFRLPKTAPRALIETAQLGYSNVVRKLLELGVSPETPGRREETVLHIFSHMGNLTMVRYLVDHGAEVNARDRAQSTPLHWAAWAGQLEVTRELLAHKADVNAVDRDGRTALFGAAGGGFLHVVQLLLQRRASMHLHGGKRRETPMERAQKKGHDAVVKLLHGWEDLGS